MTQSTTIRWEQDETGVVTLVLDDPNQSANTMNQAFKDSIAAVADRAEAEKDSIRASSTPPPRRPSRRRRPQDMIKVGPENAQAAFDTGTAIKRSLRRIETLGKPVVAAINGAALGGGYEIALASHHRVALDTPAPGSVFPRSPSGCCRRAAVSPAPYG
ncbi:enoyl-CoA hydratase-related protein [Streptomyces sp. M10(2022)]